MKQKNGAENAGSIAYNRLDFQISQAMLLAVEWEDCEDYTIVMDFYEDIAIFEGIQGNVSLFQIKTSEEPFTLSHILREDWFKKLCKHIKAYGDRVKELSLITNCPIKLKNGTIKKDKKTYITKVLSGDLLQKVLKNIEEEQEIPKQLLDDILTHRKTTLGIDNHDHLSEKFFADFIQRKYSSIELRLANAITTTVRELLRTAQKEESLSIDTEEDYVFQLKGVSKETLNKVIEDAAYVEPLDFDTVEKFTPLEIRDTLYKPYIELLNDRKKNRSSYKNIYFSLKNVVTHELLRPKETVWQFCCRCVNTCICKDEKIRIYSQISPKHYLELLALNIYFVHHKL